MRNDDSGRGTRADYAYMRFSDSVSPKSAACFSCLMAVRREQAINICGLRQGSTKFRPLFSGRCKLRPRQFGVEIRAGFPGSSSRFDEKNRSQSMEMASGSRILLGISRIWGGHITQQSSAWSFGRNKNLQYRRRGKECYFCLVRFRSILESLYGEKIEVSFGEWRPGDQGDLCFWHSERLNGELGWTRGYPPGRYRTVVSLGRGKTEFIRMKILIALTYYSLMSVVLTIMLTDCPAWQRKDMKYLFWLPGIRPELPEDETMKCADVRHRSLRISKGVICPLFGWKRFIWLNGRMWLTFISRSLMPPGWPGWGKKRKLLPYWRITVIL